MKRSNQLRGAVTFSLLCLGLSTILAAQNAYPEAYISGQFGATILGNKLRDVELTDFSPSGTMSDRSLTNSPLIGLKIGYYFPKARWFGLETEAYHMTPHIKQQSATVTIPTGAVLRDFGPVPGGTFTGTLSGDHFRVITWVPVNVMIRYPKTRLQPYIGFGPALFMGRVTTTIPQFAGSQSSTRIGLNVKGGAEYYFTRHVTAFTEVKWNYTGFDFSGTSAGGFGFRTIYSPVILAVGISYHF